MKAFRIVAIVVGSLALLFAITVMLAFTPAVQTWAVRKALASQPGMSIGRVAAGTTSAELTDVRLTQAGAIITIPQLTADYSAWSYFREDRIDVSQVIARNVVVDLRRPPPAATSGGNPPATQSPADAPDKASPPPPRNESATTPFEGLLQAAKLPFEIRVASLTAEGRTLLPAEKTVTFELQARDIQTGRQGSVEWKAEFADPAPTATVRRLNTTGTIGMHISADGRLDVVEIDGRASVEGAGLPADQITLRASAAQPATGGNESYAATIGLLRANASEPLVKLDATFDRAQREIGGAWTIGVRTEQLAALLSGLGLPEIAAQGQGTFAFNPATSAAAAKGELRADVSRLEKISPALAALGAMQIHSVFDGGFQDQVARLETLQLDLTGSGGQRLAQIATTQRVTFNVTTKRATLANPAAELARVTLQSLPLAWAQPFAKGLEIAAGDLGLVLAVNADADGSRIRARAVEPLVIRGLTLRQGEKLLADRISLSLRPQVDYSANRIVAEATQLELTSPAGDTVTGTVNAEITPAGASRAIAFTADVQARLVAALKPYLPLDPGPLAIGLGLAGRHEGDTLQLGKATATVNRLDGPRVLDATLQQPVRVDLAKGTFVAERPEASLARVALGEVPLAWAQSFLPKSQLSGNVASGTLDVLARTATDITVNAIEPLVVRAASLTLDGKPQVQALDLSLDFNATMAGPKIRYDVRRLEARQASVPLATVTAAGEATTGKAMAVTAKGTLDADLAALSGQPALQMLTTLSRGRVGSTFDITYADAISAKATLQGRGLTARQDNRLLGDLDVTLDATMKTDGSGTLRAPIVLANGNRRSDLTVDASFGKAGESFQVDGRVTSAQLIIDDFKPLAGIGPGATAGTPAPPTPAPGAPPTPGVRRDAPVAPLPGSVPARTSPTSPVAKRDAKPFWSAARGQIAVDLQNVIYGRDYPIRGIRGRLTIADTRLALEGMEGRMKENPFKASGTVTFDGQQAKPYTLAGAANIAKLDVGDLLRAANPSEKPALDATVDVVANLNGTGSTLADLGKNVYGTFDLTGSDGVLRALGRRTQMASAGSALLGIAGALTGSNTTSAIAELTAAFAELKFDRFKMHVERGADLNFKVSNIEFISEIMRTVGNGRLVNRGTGEIQDQPMEIMLQFGAKGQLAALLAKAGVLGQITDDRGYQLLERTFTLGGTPAKPDSNALWKFLLAEAAARGVPALQDLLNRR